MLDVAPLIPSRPPLRALPGALPTTRRPLRPGLVARPRLVRRLAEATRAALAVVVAPAGYGKTTLLRQWEASEARPFTWITVGEAENDADALRSAIGAPRAGAVVVLDDFHVLRSPGALHVAELLAGGLPPGTLLVLASRAEPELPIGRLRAEGAVAELRADDLAMTAREARQLLRRAGLSLPAEDAATLLRQVEGWPAGLALAALALREALDLRAAVRRFSGDDRVVADYLRDVLMSQLSPEQAAFVTRTSPLGELTGPLCDAVLGRRGSGRALRELSRSNLLLAPLDRAEERYRYHPLLAEMLQADLRRGDADGALDVHRRASAWHEEHGDIEKAVDHAIAAGELDRAGELMWSLAGRCVGDMCAAPLDRWLAGLREAQIAAHPTLALAAATCCIVRGERDAAERWTDTAERAPGELRPSVRAGIAVLRAMVAREGLMTMAADAEHAIALTADQSPWRALGCLLAGVAHHLTGERELAERELDEGARRGALTAPAVFVACLAQLALLAVEDEDWAQAGELSALAREQAVALDGGHTQIGALVFAVSALAGAHHGDIVLARQDAVEARHRLATSDFSPWYAAETRIALARAELRLSEAAGARTLLADASRALRRTSDAVVLQEWIDDAWARADTFAVDAVSGPATLTTAELRVLRFLPSHLSFREVAARLHVSANTVKTQAHAVYRKLDASSRSEAVVRAREVGLIDG